MPEAEVLASAATPEAQHIGKPVSITRVRKTYGDVVAVDEASMEIAAGEFVTLLGASGSGKTTTLMTIAGFVEPDEGTIEVGGRDVTRLAPQKRNFGFVFQQYLLFPHMTVGENIAFPLQLRGVPRTEIRRRVGDTLEMVGLSGYAGRRPRELSGGQQQRVALCRVLVYKPPVILMDEPLGALDKKLREQLQAEIKNLQVSLGLTVIYVTHDQEEALVLSDRIAVMRDGRIEQCDAARTLFERPRTPFVADFVGAANFLGGRVEAHMDQHCLVRLDRGGLLPARPHPFEVGREVVVAMQPGHLAVCAPTDGFGDGTVRSATYVGTLVRLSIDYGAEMLRLEVPAAHAPAVGDHVGLTVQPSDVAVFSAEGVG